MPHTGMCRSALHADGRPLHGHSRLQPPQKIQHCHTARGVRPAVAVSAADGQRSSLKIGRDNDGPSHGPSQVETARLPAVDWRRYHIQVLFVDKSDVVRARVAAGLFESIAEWNGYGRAMLAWTAGVAVEPGSAASLSTQASLIKQAYSLGVSPRGFTRPAEPFEVEDLDRFDVLVALDPSVHACIHAAMKQYALPGQEPYYERKLALLTDFSAYPGQAAILQRGGSALLPSKMSRVLAPQLGALLGTRTIPSPNLNTETGRQEWNAMATVLMLACAGLVKYLIDAYPPDLPEYDPL